LDAGATGQGQYAVAIGKYAGRGVVNYQAANTIILNATGDELSGVSGQTGSCYIKPIRSESGGSTGNTFYALRYNPVTGELTIP